MDVSGSNNTVYYSTTVHTNITNENSFNDSSTSLNMGGCLLGIIMIVGLLIVLPWLFFTGLITIFF